MTLRYWYDFEFIENGFTIVPISIGIVADDGRTYYAVNAKAPWTAIRKNKWLMDNVIPGLPQAHGDARNHMPNRWLFNMVDPAVKPLKQIATEVRRFLTAAGPCELWGYYAAYDHVCLAQLWGPMMSLPPGIPMWTNDVQQLAAALQVEGLLPPQAAGTLHNALGDARWTRDAYAFCINQQAAQLNARMERILNREKGL